jgi:peptidoglycan/LPS O-acetylase OafA/YrhL
VALDGLRGLAALAVALFHAAIFFPALTVIAPANGYLAVDFFFVLSGFVLAHAYSERFAKGMTACAFMGRRLRRLYPLYLLSLALWLPLGIRGLMSRTLDPRQTIIAAVAALLYLPAPQSFLVYPLNPPTWSLFYELAANLFFAVIGRRGGSSPLSSAQLR